MRSRHWCIHARRSNRTTRTTSRGHSISKTPASSKEPDNLFGEVKDLIQSAKQRAAVAINAELTQLYWQVGQRINTEVLKGERANYGKQIIAELAKKLTATFGRGWSNNKEGDGSKSEKLASALENAQPIIIVTIQTFPYVLAAIENSTSLKERRYAVIADEAHSSQTGSTARKLKEVLMVDSSDKSAEDGDEDKQLSSEDVLDATVAATLSVRRGSSNLNYYAFTATPKAKTLELFGRLPKPDQPASEKNLPEAFHVYSMRQAIEEGFILARIFHERAVATAQPSQSRPFL